MERCEVWVYPLLCLQRNSRGAVGSKAKGADGLLVHTQDSLGRTVDFQYSLMMPKAG